MWHTAKKRVEREEQILLSLKKLDYLTRSQIQKLHDLGKDRNATRILKNMEDYINHFREGENIYYLSAEGRKRVGATKARRRSSDAMYYIWRNYIYMKYGCPDTWESDVKIDGITADATFTVNGKLYVVETDRLPQNNEEKIAKYRELLDNGAFETTPIFIWVANTEFSKMKLEDALQGLNSEVYLLNDLQEEMK